MDEHGRRSSSFAVEIFAVSLAAVILEISYTRIFSFKLYYYFTYLIIGLALLGIGTGGMIVAVLPALRRTAPARTIATTCACASVAVSVGYFIVAKTQLNAFDLTESAKEIVKLVVIALTLFLPFLAAGMVVATILAAHPERASRLYAADLTGAGLGCAFAVPLLSTLTPPGCVVLSGFVLGLASLRAGASARAHVAMSVASLASLGAALLLATGRLPDPIPDRVKTLGNSEAVSKVIFSSWSSVFRIDVLPHPLQPDASYLLNHDGNWGSVMYRFNGDVSTLARFETDPRALPFKVLPPSPKVLIIGAAGGHEILASLYFGAAHITAVELNPVTVSLLTTRFADFSGHLADNERVTLVNAEGRSFLKHDDTRYDLIWFVAPDSYAAMNAAMSGAFVLSESYLYTVEMLTESLHHLTPGGITCAQFGEINFAAKPNRTLRYLTTAREALRRSGVPAFADHVLVATMAGPMTMSTIIVKRTAFDPEEAGDFADAVASEPGSLVRWAGVRSAAADGAGYGPVAKVVDLPDEALRAWYASYPYDVRPVTDDSPFFWHFARFRDALRSGESRKAHGVYVDIEDLTGERVLLVLLAFVTIFSAICMFLPLAMIRDVWNEIPFKTAAGVYFAALGIGFMFFEVSLIQMLTLFLGYPSYSLSVTLFGMLVFSGVGSWMSARYRGARRRTLLRLLGAVAMLMLFYRLGLPPIVDHWIGAPLALRCVLAILLIAPLGICLGAFMPPGLGAIASVTDHHREFVAWAWAVNGFFSVISSILSTMLSMTIGFKMLLLIAVLVYAAGAACFLRLPDRGTVPVANEP